MTRTATIVNAMQAILLATILTPATGYAEPLSTRQMLAQAQMQSQNQAAKDEVRRIDHGLTVSPAEAATKGAAQRPVEIPLISAPELSAPVDQAPAATVEMTKAEILVPSSRKVDTPPAPTTNSNFETAATSIPGTASGQGPSVVTLSAPTQTAADPAPSQARSSVEIAGVATTPAPATPVTTEATAHTTSPAATSAVEATPVMTMKKVDSAKVAPIAKTPSTKTANAQSSKQRRSSGRGEDSSSFGGFTVSDRNVGSQLTIIMNRPEVKSILAQYGLN